MVKIRVNEADLEPLKPQILSNTAWNELKSCNLPYRQLFYALQKDAIPRKSAKLFAKSMKGEKQFLILSGDIGTGKTTIGIRYLIRLLTNGVRPVIYLMSGQLREIYEKVAFVFAYEHDVLGYRSKVSCYRTSEDCLKISFPDLCMFYQAIMVDDLKGTETPILSELIEMAYQTGTYLIVTTNLTRLEGLSDMAKSRFEQFGKALLFEGDDTRRVR